MSILTTLLVALFWICVILYFGRPLIGWLFNHERFRVRRHTGLELVALGALAGIFVLGAINSQ